MWGILQAYKILGPIGLFLAFIGLLDTVGWISVSERGLGSFYTLFAVIIYAIGLSLIPLAIICPIIAVRYWRTLPVMLPALLMSVAILAMFTPVFLGRDDEMDSTVPVTVLALAAAVAATWAGWFATVPDGE